VSNQEKSFERGDSDLGSEDVGFLPFLAREKPILNSLALLEILTLLEGHNNFQGAIEQVKASILQDIEVVDISLVAPAELHLDDGVWTCWFSTSSGVEPDHRDLLSIGNQHAIRDIAKRGLVARTTTSGYLVLEDSSGDYSDHGEKYELICIPLFFNLEAKAALLVVCERTEQLYELELALVSGVQAIFSYFFFNYRNDTKRSLSTSKLNGATQDQYGFSSIQADIARELLSNKSDLQILNTLNISISELNNHLAAIGTTLLVKTREEVIDELIALRFS
jgi:hypothetical protein